MKKTNVNSASNAQLLKGSREKSDIADMDDEDDTLLLTIDKKRTREFTSKDKSNKSIKSAVDSNNERVLYIPREKIKVSPLKSDDVEIEEDSDTKTQMEKDIADRDAFVARLIDRDDQKTKKLAADASGGLTSSQIQELATKGSLVSKDTDDNRVSMVDQLREISRQHYLEKREAKEIKLLELSMQDEEELFENTIITKEEKKRRELSKKILDMAKDRNRFEYKDNGYQMPDSYEDEHGRLDREKRDAVLTSRYQLEEEVKTEQETWEEEQVKMSKAHFGAKDRKTLEENEKYSLLMDNQIEFISQEILKGTRKQLKKG